MDYRTCMWTIIISVSYTQASNKPVSICDGTGKSGQKDVIGCVLFGDKYSQSQWAVCLNETFLGSQYGLKHHTSCRKDNKNCWYPCEMSAYSSNKGRVHKECKCYYNKNKKVKLDSSCYIKSDTTVNTCTWFDKCLRVQLEDVLKCDHRVTTYIVENARRLCQANIELLKEVPDGKRNGLERTQSCLQLPLMPLLFHYDSSVCTDLVEQFKSNAKHCFTSFMKEWICDIPKTWVGKTRQSAYRTMKSELMAILELETYDDIYANKWFFQFLKLSCDIEISDPIVKRILLSTSLQSTVEDLGLQLAKTAKWKDRCVAYDSKLMHNPSRESLSFIQISIFPYDRYDFFTKSCEQEPNMERKLNTLVLNANEHSNILLVMKCKDGEKECIEADSEKVLEGDDKCLSIGGRCEEERNPCPGVYAESVVCSNKKKCCIEQGDDTVCPALGGKCIEDFERCLSGSIIPAKCGAKRHCCVSYYIEQDTAQCPNVKIISRESWGARKSVDDFPLRTDIEMPYFILHNTAGKRCSGLDKCSKDLAYYQHMHMYEHGWNDIGYNFIIDDNGNVYETVGWKLRGIHSHDFNARSYAASFFGTFTNEMPTSKAINATFKVAECGVSNNWIADDFSYLGHRDVRPISLGNKDCPGFEFYKEMNTWKRFSHIAVLSYSKEDDQECLDSRGQCLDTKIFTTCVNGTFHEKKDIKCTGHSNRKCCVPNE